MDRGTLGLLTYSTEFELIRIALQAQCTWSDPDASLKRCLRSIQARFPNLQKPCGDLLIAHRRALLAFRVHGCSLSSEGKAAVRDCRKAHYDALADLVTEIRSAALPASTLKLKSNG